MSKFLIAVLSVLLCVSMTLGHSWVACTDYRYTSGANNEKYYSDDVCYGYPPGWASARGSEFGADTGYNFQAPSGSCQQKYSDGYTSAYPKAVWVPGSQVCMAWPAKNHAKGSCTNQYIPDGGVVVIVKGSSETTINLGSADADDGQAGFQNCPAFCENGVSDKILCHRCFTVPALADGDYKVVWEWIFNPGDPYITCFDVTVSASGTPNTNVAPSSSANNGGSSTSAAESDDDDDTTEVVATGDYNAIMTRYPIKLTNAPVTVDISYVCKGGCVITVDLLNADDGYAWYGKGSRTFSSASSGTTSLTLTPQNNPPMGNNYILKAWVVESQFSSDSQPWLYEASRHEVTVAISNQVEYNVETNGNNNEELTEGSSSSLLIATLALGAVLL